MKFGRYYEIRIKTPNKVKYAGGYQNYPYMGEPGKLITIKPPMTAIIDVDRHMRASVNNATVTLYNLSPDTRSLIYKDKYTTVDYWQMSIMASYDENNLYEIFRGNIQEAYSYKQNTEWITYIDAFDGAYAIQNGSVSETVGKNVSKSDIITRLIHTMPNIFEGAMGSPTQGSAPRGQVLIGSSFNEIQRICGNQAFIDSEKINILADDEIINGNPFLLTGSTGPLEAGNLFTTPKRRETYLELDALFSPEIRVGASVEIQSGEKKYNGQYRVFGVKHSITISGAQSGDAISSLSLDAGAKIFQGVI